MRSRARGTAILVFPNVPVSVRTRLPCRWPETTAATPLSSGCPARRPSRGRDKAASSSPRIISSISPRTRSRIPLSMGSNQSSKSLLRQRNVNGKRRASAQVGLDMDRMIQRVC
jgi:hypothetical protein